MPELPEVETMVRGIRHQVLGRKIANAVACPNHCRPISITPPLKRLQKLVVGQPIISVRRLGKRVVIDLENRYSIVIEPRMTGLVLLSDPPDVEHLRVRFDLEPAAKYDSVWFWDRRGLGTLTLFYETDLRIAFGPGKLGPDALEMTAEDWGSRCAQTGREIKVMLLDQKVAAGIGNLYASEILHHAGIAPMAEARLLTKSQVFKLAKSVQLVLSRAVELEGSTLGDGTYRNALNQSGTYQSEHRVYMKSGQTCSGCGTGLITRIVQAQRSTFYCPTCQFGVSPRKIPPPQSSRRQRTIKSDLTDGRIE